MSRTLTRPMFRKGGMAQREKYMGGGIKTIRPKYMGGGLTGIMSGIVPDAGLTPRTGFQDGTELDKLIAAQELTDPSTIIYDKDYIQKLLDQKTRKLYEPGLPGYGQQIATPDTPTQRGIKEYLETNPEGAYELFKTGKLPGFGDTDYGALQAAQAKKAKEAGIDLNLGETKTEKSIDSKENKTTDIDTSTGTKEQSDLENLQEYMKMFEAAAAGDPDEARKSRYLELAKFGANLIAQPGGDLVGSIGKAASSSIGGLSKQMADEQAARRQGKLMGLKAGLDKTDMGEFGKKIKALAKFSGQTTEQVAKKFLSGDTDFDDNYLVAAEQAGVEPGASQKIYLQNIKKMFDQRPDIAAKLNKPFPKKNPVEGEYYVLPGGEFTRYVDGEKLKPSDPGFYDKED